MALRPILDAFGIRRAIVVSMQAISGTGYRAWRRWIFSTMSSRTWGRGGGKGGNRTAKCSGHFRDTGGFYYVRAPNRVAARDRAHRLCVSLELGRAPHRRKSAKHLNFTNSAAPSAALPQPSAKTIEIRDHGPSQPRKTTPATG